ncbi:hypothetical protein [Streptomyces sp. UNOC14_S4]|uniref:hypothetical protein n=1 Tax=Streptomyces sp. UNOC14_S4 TaxID=2872340 RepID=UPI001E31CAD7|nr:hypothetical protein [Streptomyces sp. UNOC14_S4]MCC3770899.1 hypothetical protein [Streptomyces sp. UNOC14_S4]
MMKADRPDLERAWRYVVTTPHGPGPGSGYVAPPDAPGPTCLSCCRIDADLAQAVRSGDVMAETRIARQRAAHWSSMHRTVQW